MSTSAIRLGQLGEGLAVEHLTAQRMLILDRNWRCRRGEIDIVALDGNTLVIVEVKTRRSARFGSPFEAVTPHKMARLRRLGAQWLRVRGGSVDRIRVDVVGVVVNGDGTATIEQRRGLD